MMLFADILIRLLFKRKERESFAFDDEFEVDDGKSVYVAKEGEGLEETEKDEIVGILERNNEARPVYSPAVPKVKATGE
jgi:hypothetical protein